MKRIVILGISVLFCCVSMAQVNIVFIPDINGRTVDGLGMFQVQNLTGKALNGFFVINVRESTNRVNVLTVKTAPVSFPAGVSTFPKGSFISSSFAFANNPVASIASQTRSFPSGEYSFCFHFMPTDTHNGDEYENCFDATIQPLVPISLINPADKDTICQKRPMLSWQPPLPFNAAMRFRLLLTEKKDGTSVENLLANTPLILLDNISSTSINYPSTSPELTEGKTYCWQVIAYQEGIILSKSEIWEFTVQCKTPPVAQPADSYRDIKLLAGLNYYISTGTLKFSFTNNYNVKKLSYTIIDIDNDFKEIKNLPDLVIQPGLNKIDVDLDDIGLTAGKHYIIKVLPFNEPNVQMKFVYQPVNN